MNVCILVCGTPPKDLAPEFGTFDEMFRQTLDSHRRYSVLDVTTGRLPDAASLAEAYVLTGSAAGVYDDLPWIHGLAGFLREVRGRTKLVGICFGHQLMAAAFGGSVEKSENGWGIGLQRYEMSFRAPWMDEATHVNVAALHQDQVVACPSGARITATSEFTRFAGLDYGDAISFQFHPEFTSDFGRTFLESRRDRLGPSVDEAIASYDRNNDRAQVARWINRFLDC